MNNVYIQLHSDCVHPDQILTVQIALQLSPDHELSALLSLQTSPETSCLTVWKTMGLHRGFSKKSVRPQSQPTVFGK